MKNLGKTIEKILRIEPELESDLSNIKSKWKRYPKRSMLYWKQLFQVLNSDGMLQHPKRNEIKNILIPQRRDVKHAYSFEEAGPNESIIGLIPENISDKIKQHDRLSIKLGKRGVEASMTRNKDMMVDLQRHHARMEINLKKIWFDIKDHFHLWDKGGHYTIKKRGSFLVLSLKQQPRPQYQMPSPPPPSSSPDIPLDAPDGVGFIKMHPNMLKEFFKYLGMTPPPGIFPEEDGDGGPDE